MWTPAYFKSSGTGGVYTTSDRGKTTTSANLDGGAPNGADPSCGSKDTETWNKCDMGSKTNKFNITHTLAYQQALNSGGANTCVNCKDATNPTNKDCNGHIILTDESNSGKVAVLAHGAFGQLPSIWSDTSGTNAVCTTDHFGCGYDKSSYGELVSKFEYVVKNGAKDLGLAGTYIKTYSTTPGVNCVLITKQAFLDATLEKVWNSLGTVANDGVALSWGHGFYGNGCGDKVFVKQGENKTLGTPNPNNIALNLQIGTRAWSGEMSDNIETNSQTYIVEGMVGAADSATCLQPLIMPMSKNDVFTLFEFLHSKATKTGGSTTSKKCIYTGTSTNPAVKEQCTQFNGDETSCKNVALNWNCKWQP